MEIYYAIMNILDYLALHEEISIEKQNELYDICERLVGYQDGTKLDFINSISDANDCGICNTFQEMVIELRKLHKKGERI